MSTHNINGKNKWFCILKGGREMGWDGGIRGAAEGGDATATLTGSSLIMNRKHSKIGS